MKLLSIIIPSYNSEPWLEGCLNSLLIGRDEELDVIVVNDGSKDKTSEIGHKYAEKYDFIRIIDQVNKGHGGAINTGVKSAQGLYTKILDSDDKLEEKGLKYLLDLIKKHNEEGNVPDFYLSDYTNVTFEGKTLYVTSLKSKVKESDLDKVITFKEFKRIPFYQYLMLHMFYIKTSVLIDNNLNLLEKTFYEDNELVFFTLLNSRTLCYIKEPIYLYAIGREGQSVSIESMDKNYMHQVRVMSKVIEMLDEEKFRRTNKYKQRQLFHEIYIIAYLFFTYTHLKINKQKETAFNVLSKYFKETKPFFYYKLMFQSMYFITWLVPPFLRGWVTTNMYLAFSKRVGWR